MRSDRRHADGFTLVELLVVVVILGIVGAIVTASLISGLRADGQARNRIEAFEDMQIALERVSREVRAADPILTADTNADSLTVRVRRETTCHDFTYQVNGGTLDVTQVRRVADCSTILSTSEQALVGNLEPMNAVFEYWTEDGIELPDPSDPPRALTTQELADVATVQISFDYVLELGQQPVTVSTIVGVRNN